MSTHDDEDNIKVAMYVLRCVRDPDKGLNVEPCTRKQMDFDLEKYCGVKLGEGLLQDKLVRVKMQMHDDGTEAPVHALLFRQGLNDFSEYLGLVDGYRYVPLVKGSTSFGYRAIETIAWVHPHRDGPVVFWRQGDERGESAVMYWLDHYCRKIETGEIKPASMPWPVGVNANHELVVPVTEHSYFGSARRIRSAAPRRHVTSSAAR